MKRLSSRVADLEARQTGPLGRWHRLIQHEGQTQDEAIDAYGRHLIREHDHLIINRVVSPKWEADGRMIPQSGGVTVSE